MVNTLKQVYKTIYSNTHPFTFVYSQRQEIRSMTAIYAMASPIRSRVPGFSSPPVFKQPFWKANMASVTKVEHTCSKTYPKRQVRTVLGHQCFVKDCKNRRNYISKAKGITFHL